MGCRIASSTRRGASVIIGAVLTSAFGLGALGCSDRSIAQREPPNFVPDAASADGAMGDGSTTNRANVVRVATFNVRRFFDTVCDTGRCGGSNFEQQPTDEAFDAKADALAKAIAIVAPDIIALEEVETSRALEALRSKLTAAGLDYPIARLGETGSPASIDVAILAKGTLEEVRTHADMPLTRPDGSSTTFTRELLEVRLSLGGRPIVMFAAHFRSKVDDDPGRRLAEARATRAIVTAVGAERPEALVVLGGDLNDVPGSPPLTAIEEDGGLVRVASDRPIDAQATTTFQGTGMAIDHLYVTAAQAARYIPGSATVYREGTRGFATSDHGALAADFSSR